MTPPLRGDSAPAAPGSIVPRCYALVPCAGTGTRAGTAGPKQYEPLAGRALVLWTLEALARVDAIVATLVVLSPGDARFAALAAVAETPSARDCWTAPVGGATRAETVAAGLAELLARGARADDWVLVHDAARCLLRPEWVARLIADCADDPVGGLLAQPIPDTLKRGDADGARERVSATVSRHAIWAAQTPQMFRIGVLADALRDGLARADLVITDEASAIEATGRAPRLVRGDVENFKVTWPEDFALAERLLRTRDAPPKATP